MRPWKGSARSLQGHRFSAKSYKVTVLSMTSRGHEVMSKTFTRSRLIVKKSSRSSQGHLSMWKHLQGQGKFTKYISNETFYFKTPTIMLKVVIKNTYYGGLWSY